MLARFVGGISKGNISLSMAVITDVSNKDNRGKAMALVGIAFSFGFILGPMIGAMFSKFSDKTTDNWFVYPAMFAICLSILDILFVAIYVKETLPKVCSDFSLTMLPMIRLFMLCKKFNYFVERLLDLE